MRGRFIVIEGLDGAGTTTQVERLVAALGASGSVLATREPTDGPIGKLIRAVLGGAPAPDWLALPWLFAADRADHLARKVEPALAQGVDVVSDRYYHSSLAYQSLTLPLAEVAALNRFRAPDLTIFVQVSVDTALSRIAARGAALEIFETRERLERIAAAYADVLTMLAARGERVVTVSGEGAIEHIAAEIVAAVQAVQRP